MRFALFALFLASSSFAAEKPALRCGWINNETPGNYTLADRDGIWIISAQGGRQAEGDVADAPNENEMVNTNGPHGYWCGCINATVDLKEKAVLKIFQSKGEKLVACIHDKSLNQSFVPRNLVHSIGKAFTECVDREEQLVGFHQRQACVNKAGDYYFLAE